MPSSPARARVVGLVTTAGYEDTLQVARSFCPGGLGGWVCYFVKSPLLAPLELTIGAARAHWRRRSEVVRDLDEDALRRRDLVTLKAAGEVPDRP